MSEAKRLYKMGFAVMWLHAKSKRPKESKWTSGERQNWLYLQSTYIEGDNVGVRLGEASKIQTDLGENYLACIDLDIKNPLKKDEALASLKILTEGIKHPTVKSGSGNGARHLYCMTAKPFKMITYAKNDDWEICIYSTGRQMVLPPSIHPDTGNRYEWVKDFTNATMLPLRDFSAFAPAPGEPKAAGAAKRTAEGRSGVAAPLVGFAVTPVDLEWLPISDGIRDAIISGAGVTDRSGYLLKASSALLSAGLTQNEVLTILTDRETFVGKCGYDHAKTSDRVRAAEWVYKYTFKKIADERNPKNIFSVVTGQLDEVKLSPEAIKEQNEEFEEDRDWRQGILRGGDRGSGAPLKLVQNVVTILRYAVGDYIVRRDEFAYRDSYGCDTPWGGVRDAMITDDDVARIKYWLGKNWRFEPGDNTISDALTVIACENAYDPVKDMLDALPTWDGTPRLNTWLSKYFEAKGNAEYNAQVFRKWMVAMVMRVYRPGAKFDWMPIFEGAQGVGKSSFGRILVGDKYFLDWLPNLSDKDSALSLQGMWGTEMGELSQFRKNELESIKAFVTRTVDKLRPPYGRRLIESPRRCVFFGTTNRATYLTDDTGNRRFKPLEVGALDFEALIRDRDQLFAEAKYLFDQKIETERTLDLSGEAKEYERKIHVQKMVADESNAMIEAMQDFIEKVREGTANLDLEKFRILELFKVGGALPNFRPENRNLQFAAKMLKKLGAEDRLIRGLKYWKLPIPQKGGGFDDEPDTHIFDQ